jgi:hypothetical protein
VRWWGKLPGVVVVIAAISWVSVLTLTTGADAAAGETTDALERGVLYESLKFDQQQLSFFVIDVTSNGETELVMTVHVTCGGGLTGSGTFPGRVDTEGRLRARGPVRDQDGDDTFTVGKAEVSGRVKVGGTVTGTIAFDLLEHDQMDRNDVRGKCKRTDDPWTVRGGDADTAFARIEGVVEPQDDDIADGWVPTIAADADAVYFAVEADVGAPPYRVVKVDPTDGTTTWSTRIDVEPRSLVVRDGAMWVASDERVLRMDAGDGDVTAEIDATWVSIAPDGAVWVASDRSRTVRRLDPATAEEQERFDVRAELSGIDDSLVASADAVYTLALSEPAGAGGRDPVVLRLDPSTGAINTAEGPDAGGITRQLVADGDTLWLLSTVGVERRDGATLAVTNEYDAYPAYGAVAAPPGLWVPDYFAVQVVDAAAAPAFVLPTLGGPLAAGHGDLWLYDRTFGLVHIAGSGPA